MAVVITRPTQLSILDENMERCLEIDRETERLTVLEETRLLESKLEKLANLKMRNSDTIVLSGHGCYIKVRNDGLSVEYSVSGSQENVKVLTMHRGVHRIKQIIIVAKSGYISLDAIEWTANQGITVIMLNFKGELLSVLTPKQPRNVKLMYLQWQASKSELVLTISKELIKMKTHAQIETLKAISHKQYHANYRFNIPTWKVIENELTDLDPLQSIESVRMFEARLSMMYWGTFKDIPIAFDGRSAKKVPTHWLQVTERQSQLSNNARQATNPFHATLNFAYALLEAQVLQALTIAGLEPSIGYLHTYQENKPALAWDMMEAFRAVIDHKVFDLFQKQTFSEGDFYQELTGEVRLSEELRRYIVASCRVSPIDIDRQVRWLRSLLEKS